MNELELFKKILDRQGIKYNVEPFDKNLRDGRYCETILDCDESNDFYYRLSLFFDADCNLLSMQSLP